MPRWLRIALLGVLLLTVVDGAYLVAVSDLSANSLVHEKHEANDQYEGFNAPVAIILSNIAAYIEAIVVAHKEFLLVFSGVAVAVFTFRLYRATVGLVDMAKTQAKSMMDSLLIANKNANAAQESAQAAQFTAETMRDTARKQLRAYLGIASAELDSGLKLGEPVTVTLQFKNFGQTPAYKCVASMNCAHLDFGDEVIDFPFDLDPELVGTIHPGEPLFKSRIGPPLSAEDLAAIRGRKKAIWLFGTFTYEVAFDMPPRKTQFLYFLTALENGQITSKNLGICEYGNTAD